MTHGGGSLTLIQKQADESQSVTHAASPKSAEKLIVRLRSQATHERRAVLKFLSEAVASAEILHDPFSCLPKNLLIVAFLSGPLILSPGVHLRTWYCIYHKRDKGIFFYRASVTPVDPLAKTNLTPAMCIHEGGRKR